MSNPTASLATLLVIANANAVTALMTPKGCGPSIARGPRVRTRSRWVTPVNFPSPVNTEALAREVEAINNAYNRAFVVVLQRGKPSLEEYGFTFGKPGVANVRAELNNVRARSTMESRWLAMGEQMDAIKGSEFAPESMHTLIVDQMADVGTGLDAGDVDGDGNGDAYSGSREDPSF